MTEEIFDVVDEFDRVLRQAPRSIVHSQKWLHRAVHIFVLNSRGELLLQLRTSTKDEYPRCYTSSASGHLHAGEDYLPAAHRELAEELGLICELEFLKKFPAGAETSFEHTELYRTTTDAPPVFDPAEIESGEFVAPTRLAQWINDRPDEFTPCFRTLFWWYWETIVGNARKVDHRLSAELS
jgi:isopentenyl-diphosphate delta-isomerase